MLSHANHPLLQDACKTICSLHQCPKVAWTKYVKQVFHSRGLNDKHTAFTKIRSKLRSCCNTQRLDTLIRTFQAALPPLSQYPIHSKASIGSKDLSCHFNVYLSHRPRSMIYVHMWQLHCFSNARNCTLNEAHFGTINTFDLPLVLFRRSRTRFMYSPSRQSMCHPPTCNALPAENSNKGLEALPTISP